MNDYNFQPDHEVLITTNSAFYRNIYESRIISVDEDMLCISMPYYKGLYIPLNVGFILNLRINTGEDVVSFTSEILYRNVSRRCLFLRIPAHKDVQSKKISNNCKFVTITSGKGGVGKSCFAVNYAITLSKLGKKVLLFDADLGMANLDVLLKCNTEYNIVDLIDGRKSINEVICQAPGEIDIIAGGSGMQRLANLSVAQYNRISIGFTFLENSYDYVIFDTGAGLSKNVTNFIFASDETIIVTTPEPHAITDAYAIIKVALEEERDITLKLLVNKCETPAEGAEVLNRITNVVKNFLNYSIVPFGVIPESRFVSRSVKEQSPYVLAYPSSDVTRILKELTEKEISGTRREEAASRGFKSFASKFFNLFRNA